MSREAEAPPAAGAGETAPVVPSTPAEVAALEEKLTALAPDQALGVLEELASAVFPGGVEKLAEVSWEPTTTPPAIPSARTAHPPGAPEEQSDAIARLQVAELRYRTLVEQIPAVTFMAVLGEGENEVYVSPHIETLLGFTQKEWLEDPILWYQQLHPADRALWVREFARGIRTGGPFRAECRLIARDGRIVWVRGEARLIKDELGRPLFLQGVAFDITESKRAQEQVLQQAVQRTEERYRDLVELLGAIFWEADAQTGAFIFVSRGAERILGCSPEEWLADPEFWLSRVHPEDRPRVSAAWRRALAQRQDQQFEFRALASDARVVWLHNSVHFPDPRSADSRPLGVLLDITDRRRWEERLSQALTAAENARRAAEAANRLKDEFLATMSHELRTPINAVLGWSGILESGIGDPELETRALTAIKSNAQAQAQIVDDLLDVSRIVTGKLQLEIRRVVLAPLLQETVETIRLAAEAKRIRLTLEPNSPRAAVRGDANRLRQVLNNLLTNAVKFTPPGGSIRICLDTVGDLARVRVIDSGEGIEPDFLPYVFDRFRQADASATRIHGGLGLGLAIVRHLVELHGGRVSADSAGKGKGATFTVELPLARRKRDVRARTAKQSRSRPPEQPDTSPPAPEAALSRARILVIDDNADALELLVVGLSRAGALATGAQSAAVARKLLKAQKFDLIVSDIAMPSESGLELMRSLRALAGPNRETTAVAFTALAGDQHRDAALEAGFQLHLTKPLDATRLIGVLAELLPRPAGPVPG